MSSTKTSPIRTFDDPVLSQVCHQVDVDEDLRELFAMMRSAAYRIGVGLGAPQVGVLKSVAFINYNRNQGFFMVNPVITDRIGPRVIETEGCLSYPDFYTPVERWHSVKVNYRDEHGKQWTAVRFNGYAARVVQHECDHLDGVCLVGDAWRRAKAGAP